MRSKGTAAIRIEARGFGRHLRNTKWVRRCPRCGTYFSGVRCPRCGWRAPGLIERVLDLIALGIGAAMMAWGLYLALVVIILDLMPPLSYAGGLGLIMLFFGGLIVCNALLDRDR